MQEEAIPSRVLLYDGGSLFRHSVQGVLETEGDLRVVADGRRVGSRRGRSQTDPDVALVDADAIGSELPSFVARIRASARAARSS